MALLVCGSAEPSPGAALHRCAGDMRRRPALPLVQRPAAVPCDTSSEAGICHTRWDLFESGKDSFCVRTLAAAARLRAPLWVARGFLKHTEFGGRGFKLLLGQMNFLPRRER